MYCDILVFILIEASKVFDHSGTPIRKLLVRRLGRRLTVKQPATVQGPFAFDPPSAVLLVLIFNEPLIIACETTVGLSKLFNLTKLPRILSTILVHAHTTVRTHQVIFVTSQPTF